MLSQNKRRRGVMKGKKRKKSIRVLLCGGFAGVCAKTCVSPLERVRILAQTRPVGGKINPFSLGAEVFASEGIRGFWRGNGANVLRVFPSRGILFMANDRVKDFFKRLDTKGEYHSSLAFASGSIAGVIAAVTTYPLDLTRTRLTSQVGSNNSIRSTLMNTVRNEGFWALYRGMGPTTFGAVPYEGIKFGVYDALKEHVPVEWFGSKVVCQLFCGGAAGTVAGVVMYPNDTVRRLMQVQVERGSKRKYKNMIDCYTKVFQEHGPKRFYRGLGAFLLRAIPNASIQFCMFEVFKGFAGMT
jgi:hypothetical protein